MPASKQTSLNKYMHMSLGSLDLWRSRGKHTDPSSFIEASWVLETACVLSRGSPTRRCEQHAEYCTWLHVMNLMADQDPAFNSRWVGAQPQALFSSIPLTAVFSDTAVTAGVSHALQGRNSARFQPLAFIASAGQPDTYPIRLHAY